MTGSGTATTSCCTSIRITWAGTWATTSGSAPTCTSCTSVGSPALGMQTPLREVQMTKPVNPFVRVITRGSLGAIALVALAVLPAAVCGQSIGIKGGWSYGDVSNSGVLPGAASDRSGFAIGVGALTSNTVGLGIEALYAQRGVSSSVFGDSRRLDYFDVPVYLRVAVPTPLI